MPDGFESDSALALKRRQCLLPLPAISMSARTLTMNHICQIPISKTVPPAISKTYSIKIGPVRLPSEMGARIIKRFLNQYLPDNTAMRVNIFNMVVVVSSIIPIFVFAEFPEALSFRNRVSSCTISVYGNTGSITLMLPAESVELLRNRGGAVNPVAESPASLQKCPVSPDTTGVIPDTHRI